MVFEPLLKKAHLQPQFEEKFYFQQGIKFCFTFSRLHVKEHGSLALSFFPLMRVIFAVRLLCTGHTMLLSKLKPI